MRIDTATPAPADDALGGDRGGGGGEAHVGRRPRRPLSRVWAFLSRRDVYHVLFWVAAAAVLFWVERPIDSSQKVVAVATSLGFYAAIVYFNLNYLFPNYLTDKRPGLYAMFFVLAAMIATPLRAIALYWIYDSSPAIQADLLQIQSSIFLSHLAVGAGSTMLKIAADWTRSSRERQRLEAQNLQSELRFLRSQVNPHFLFNTLNSLYALTLKRSDRAPETVLKLSDMMRYMLYDSNARLVLLREEVDYVRNYLDLEKLRHGDEADIRLVIDGEIAEQRIAPMLFITFVENAFKHGLAKMLSEGYVHIALLIEGDEIRFHLENAKPSIDVADGKPGGIGLENVQRRLDLLYDQRYELHTLETEDTYAVDLYLNLVYDEDDYELPPRARADDNGGAARRVGLSPKPTNSTSTLPA